jgi:hypothetical protein
LSTLRSSEPGVEHTTHLPILQAGLSIRDADSDNRRTGVVVLINFLSQSLSPQSSTLLIINPAQVLSLILDKQSDACIWQSETRESRRPIALFPYPDRVFSLTHQVQHTYMKCLVELPWTCFRHMPLTHHRQTTVATNKQRY